MPRDTLELGKLLVSEVSDHGNEDTLTVWLMHYIAELITTAETETTSSTGRIAKKEACETILRLWEHRATLSGRANPMREYERALSLLHKLSNEGYFVFSGLDEAGDPIERFRQGAAALLSSLLVSMLPAPETGGDVAIRSLSETERTLLQELQTIRIRRLIKKGGNEEDDDPSEILKRDIRDDVKRVRKSLDAIEAMFSV